MTVREIGPIEFPDYTYPDLPTLYYKSEPITENPLRHNVVRLLCYFLTGTKVRPHCIQLSTTVFYPTYLIIRIQRDGVDISFPVSDIPNTFSANSLTTNFPVGEVKSGVSISKRI